jgi:hypothetical protein
MRHSISPDLPSNLRLFVAMEDAQDPRQQSRRPAGPEAFGAPVSSGMSIVASVTG